MTASAIHSAFARSELFDGPLCESGDIHGLVDCRTRIIRQCGQGPYRLATYLN